MIRLNKYLSMCGVTSRRGADGYIKERRVTVNDTTVEELGLVIFVGIPLPVTGAWTGSLASYIFKLSYLKSLLFILMYVCRPRLLKKQKATTTLRMLSLKRKQLQIPPRTTTPLRKIPSLLYPVIFDTHWPGPNPSSCVRY